MIPSITAVVCFKQRTINRPAGSRAAFRWTRHPPSILSSEPSACPATPVPVDKFGGRLRSAPKSGSLRSGAHARPARSTAHRCADREARWRPQSSAPHNRPPCPGSRRLCGHRRHTSRRFDEQDSFASRFRIADLSLIRTVARGDPAQPRVACALRRFARRSQPHWAGSVGIRERALGFRSDTQSLLSGDECKIVVQL